MAQKLDVKNIRKEMRLFKDSIAIWGVTLWGLSFAAYLKQQNYKLDVFFIDNDLKKMNDDLPFGICCLSPNNLKSNCTYVLAVKKVENRNSIEDQIIKSGIEDKKVYYLDGDMDEFMKLIDDENYIHCLWYYFMKSNIDLQNPITFNEKLQWLKLHDRNPLYTKMVDKYEVKDYVSKKIGSKYVIPVYGIWDKWEDIDFAKLPSEFVLKCTHDSGGVVICKNKDTFDYDEAKKIICQRLEKSYYWPYREWPYANVKPRIIAEKYMEDTATKELRDYKFFVFSGVVKSMFVATDRAVKDSETKFDFFDRDYNHLNIVNGHPNAEKLPLKPKKFDEMIKLAEILGEDIPHVRIDFYEVNEKVYFGEMTFFHWAGLVPFEPSEWDYIWGDWIKLP